MSKAVLGAVEQLVEVSLTDAEKRQLLHKLTQELWDERLERLFKRVDERQKRLPPISMEEIVQEVKAVRQLRRDSSRRA